jgi:hypothetical protein
MTRAQDLLKAMVGARETAPRYNQPIALLITASDRIKLGWNTDYPNTSFGPSTFSDLAVYQIAGLNRSCVLYADGSVQPA